MVKNPITIGDNLLAALRGIPNLLSTHFEADGNRLAQFKPVFPDNADWQFALNSVPAPGALLRFTGISQGFRLNSTVWQFSFELHVKLASGSLESYLQFFSDALETAVPATGGCVQYEPFDPDCDPLENPTMEGAVDGSGMPYFILRFIVKQIGS